MVGQLLRIESLQVYGLEPVSFQLGGGECLAVQGPSGSGKTVLLRALADLDPAEGQVFLDGAERGALSGPEWRKRVRYAAAEPGWWDETPREHFTRGEGLEKLITSLGLNSTQLDQSLAKLSTGERQRMALARAVIDAPSVLLLDEPTGALDAKATTQAERLMKQRLKAGDAIILVSHDPKQVKRLADRKLTIRDGKVRIGRA
ncbi:MAG: ATP-binding cassette domain-containing protein [Methyloligellaceae bacterium]